LGFSIWSIPILKKFWERPIGKLVISIAQFLIYLLATAFARQLVASALGLPAQDFDLTISFLTVLFYIPAATLVLSVVTGAAALLFQLRMMVSSLKYSLEQAAHFLGAVALMISLSMVYSLVMKNQFALYPMTKRIDFDFDYELIPNYPAVEHDKKIRLHKNGVVSQAELKENDVVISVGRIQQ
jgi:hypothetical protein